MVTTEGSSCQLQHHKHQFCQFGCQVHPENHSLHRILILTSSYLNYYMLYMLGYQSGLISQGLLLRFYEDSKRSRFSPGKSQRTIHALHISVRTKAQSELGISHFLAYAGNWDLPQLWRLRLSTQKSQCGQAKSTQGIHELQVVSN